MPDFLALTGDTADGIPGLPGFGEKSAGTLVGAYVHLEAIPDDPSRWTVKPRGALQLAATLAERPEEALFYRTLATLVDTVPLAESLDDLRFRGVPRARFEAWCDAVGANALRTTPKRWADWADRPAGATIVGPRRRPTEADMITGAHAIRLQPDPEADRTFLREVLGLPHVDVGGGWLIFGLPPAEVAVHPADDERPARALSAVRRRRGLRGGDGGCTTSPAGRSPTSAGDC